MENSYALQHVLERYNVSDIQLAYRFEEMKGLNLSRDFILVLLKMFEEEGSFPEEELNRFSLEVIVDYITRTHGYYLAKRLPEMEQSIELMLLDCSDKHPLLLKLRNFYAQYQSDLTRHIQIEEKSVLPYIRLLLEAKAKGYDSQTFTTVSKNYSLRKFIESHADTEGDLQQIREVIQNYSPLHTNQTPYRILLTQLQLFETDLSVHAIIEDRVLIPRAIELEDTIFADQS